MAKLTIVFFDAGGGHRNAANAIKAVIEQRHLPWDVELLNLQELLDEIDPLRKFAKLRLQDGYNLLLRKGWTRFSAQMLATLHVMIRLWHPPVVRTLKQYWRRNPADVVLSVIPNFNRALSESVRDVLPAARFATLITDFADYPPHFWIERESQYVICGTERAVEQALGLGHRRENVFRISGMVLNPKLYERGATERAEARKNLGLAPDLPTALVLFGGHGSSSMLSIARLLQQSNEPLQMIFICGHNQQLAAALRKIPADKPMYVEGFTQRIGDYMSIADFLIGKPGPGSIAEALHFHLPVVVVRNSCTLPQERYNTEWVEENDVGVVLRRFDELPQVLPTLLGSRLEQLRQNAAKLKNNAVYEAVGILEKLMEANPEHPERLPAEELAHC